MKVYMETLGCPKNFNDTETAKGIMDHAGIKITGDIQDSDVMILNTCGFINDAKKESISRIFELAQYKTSQRKLIVSGCLSERYSDQLFDDMPEVDAFLGVNEYDTLPDILKQMENEEFAKRYNFVSRKAPRELDIRPRMLDNAPYSATIKISEGCDNRCAYCVIPDIRGHFRSKKIEDVISEATWLAQKGCKELILIAQDVTHYGTDLYGKASLALLLKKLCRIDGIEWIRLMYCYDDRITDELIQVMKEEPKICKYIDLPIQHSSDAVLKKMRRRSTSKSIKETVSKLRKAIPDIHIRTTLIVGFPGETEDDFSDLLDFVEEMRFARLGVFAYSQEENTPAGRMENQIPEEIKEERLDAVMRRQMEISLEMNREKVGNIMEVLVEYEEEEGTYIGRTRYDAPEIDNSVIFTSERKLFPGNIVKVLIEDAFDYDLTGMEV